MQADCREVNAIALAATLTLDEPRCPELEEMIAASEGRGDPASRLAAVEHADRCDSCRRLLSHLCAVRSVDPVPVQRIGRYTIIDVAGAGAMGLVYKAHDPELDRTVAIKLPKLDALGTSQLAREARAQALLSHPNIVPIHDVGIADGRVYIVMDWVDGMTLRGWLRAAPRSTAEILAIFEAVGRGLAAAHRSGLVHQDVKPDNVMIDRDGRPQITDFGVARQCDGVAASSAHRIAGTPLYMPPEQLRGEGGTARSDQFSFCVSLWEALFGARPFAGATQAALLEAICAGPSAPNTVTAPRHVLECLRRGLARAPANRFQSMEALLDALGSRRRSRALPAAIAIGAVAAVAWFANDLRADDAPAITSPVPAAIAAPSNPAQPRAAAPTSQASAEPTLGPVEVPHTKPHRIVAPTSRASRVGHRPTPAPAVEASAPSSPPPARVEPTERLDDRLIDPLAGLRGPR